VVAHTGGRGRQLLLADGFQLLSEMATVELRRFLHKAADVALPGHDFQGLLVDGCAP